RIRAVKRTGGATHDFGTLERVHVDEVAVGVGEAADGEGVRHHDSVGLDAHPVAAQAADADVADTEAAEVLAHGDAGLVAEQVAQVAHQQLVHALAGDHVDRVRHVGDVALGAGGGDDHAVELGRGGGGGGRGGDSLRRIGGGVRGGRGIGQQRGQGHGEQGGTH